MYKNDDFEKPFLTKAVLAGLFTGIIAAVANLCYNFIYRYITGFAMSSIVNVSTIIFASVLLLLVAGMSFFFLAKFVKGGSFIFTTVTILLTVAISVAALGFQRSPNLLLSQEFHILFIGIVAITGLLGSFMIPYFSRHTEYFI